MGLNSYVATIAQMSWIKPKACYVIMPFSDTKTHTSHEWTEIFEDIFKPTIEVLGYQCFRSKASVGLILKDILLSIHSSMIILADLTDAKPNVFYELGIAHTITNSVIMITQDLSSVPSDLRPYSVILYDSKTAKGALQFRKNLSEAINKIVLTSPAPASPIFEFLKRTHRDLECVYELAANPTALLECAKCNQVYEIPLEGMGHGGGDIERLCGHWEPAIFRGIKGIHQLT